MFLATQKEHSTRLPQQESYFIKRKKSKKRILPFLGVVSSAVRFKTNQQKQKKNTALRLPERSPISTS